MGECSETVCVVRRGGVVVQPGGRGGVVGVRMELGVGQRCRERLRLMRCEVS
jgi:hypothetical protein